MKVLVACEFSGTVREAFRELGHDAWSCDILPTEVPGNHLQGDVTPYLSGDWDLIIAHPPCTYLANSGVSWLYKEPGRWEKMEAGAAFFKKILESPCERIAVENPMEIIGRKYDQIIQPWQYGHGETKATCLWLKGLPKLSATNIVSGREQRLHRLPPSPERWKERSRTFKGIALAMAEQWTKYMEQSKAA